MPTAEAQGATDLAALAVPGSHDPDESDAEG